MDACKPGDGDRSACASLNPACYGPVNLASGDVRFTVVDMSFCGRGLPVNIARTYRSSTGESGGMAPRWTFSYHVSAAQASNGIAVYNGTGRKDLYVLGTNGKYACRQFFNEGSESNGVFTLTFADTGKWVFNPFDGSPAAGMLACIVDRNGNQVCLDYDASGKLTQILDDRGRPHTFAYDGDGRLASVADFTGRTVTDLPVLRPGRSRRSPGRFEICHVAGRDRHAHRQ